VSTVAFRDPTYPLQDRAYWERRINRPTKEEALFPGDPNARMERVYDQGYTIVTQELLDGLVDFIGSDEVFEVGAGCGYLSRVLSDRGVNIRAIDSREGECTRDPWWERPLYFNVEKIDVKEMDHLPGSMILMTWPCHKSDFALTVAQKMQRGQFLLYHGEGKGGCTATPEFFDYLRTHFDAIAIDDIDDKGYSDYNMRDHWHCYHKRSND
jgi:hypothetical protein